MDFTPFYITFKLAFLTTVFLVFLAIPLAYYLAFSKRKINVIVESIIMLPIVLPPTVLGFYFLIFLGPNSAIGYFLQDNFNISLAFTFKGILLGAIIYCTPFMVTPIMNGFRSIPKSLVEATKILGKSNINALIHVYLPYIKREVLNAILLTFAHTVGAFGIILMIGGKLAETNVAAVAIYDEMNKMNYDTVHVYALIMLSFSFILILTINLLSRNKPSQNAAG
jgi:molybdate transport system permease protein